MVKSERQTNMTYIKKYNNINEYEFLTPISSIFDEVFNNFGVTPYAGSYTKTSFPKVDVVEYIDKLVLEADVAGLDKEDVSVELEGDTLTIRGGKKPASTETDNNARYVYREIKRSSFVRSFAVGEGIDKSKIKVDYQNGAIKIILPRIKIEEQKPQKIKLL